MKDTKDLTRGPIRGHLIAMALPMAVGMGVQMLYYLIDLYFVARLGHDALAGVGAAKQCRADHPRPDPDPERGHRGADLARGRTPGRRRRQRRVLPVAADRLWRRAGHAAGGVRHRCMTTCARSRPMPASSSLGATYLYWYLPGMALQFVLTALGSSLLQGGLAQLSHDGPAAHGGDQHRAGAGPDHRWGTGHPMGVVGAALASTVSVTAGALLLLRYCMRHQSFMRIDLARLRPRLATWGSILKIGLRQGGEYLLMFAFSAFVYLMLRDFGAAAQASGIGTRVLQVVFLLQAALGFAVLKQWRDRTTERDWASACARRCAPRC
ncbi:hypothetical protein LP420_16070 [Massilia sp. B-10]|nr:hypothetical protein LP420_16070 [Massilia sp. B-10]